MPKLATLKIQSSKNELSQAFFRLTFSKKYSFPWPKSSKVKNCPNLTVKRAKKTTRKVLKMSYIKAYKVEMFCNTL